LSYGCLRTREGTTEHLGTLGLLTDLGGHCLVLVLSAGIAGVVLGLAICASIGWFAARPMMRWGLGDDPALGCLATAVMVIAGLIGGLWAGAWTGVGACARHAIGERYVVEDVVITALVVAGTEGKPTGDPVVDGQRMRDAVQQAGGSLQMLLEKVNDEVLEEDPEAEIPDFLAPEMVFELLDAVESNALFRPEEMVEISSGGGLVVALDGADPELARYAEQIVSIGEPVRDEILFAIYAAVVSNAAVTAIVAVVGPFVVLLLIAGIGRLIRMSGRRTPPPPAVPRQTRR
jgi:hypothetical protein